MKNLTGNRLQKMLGLTSQELNDILSIIKDYLIIETSIDIVGSLDPTFLTGIGAEVPEIGLDIVMCVKIWEYFNQENIDENNKFIFVDIMNSHPLEAAKSGILAYGIASVLKFSVGKVLGKAALYIGAPVISGGINAIQTTTTGLLWAKHAKEKTKPARSVQTSKPQESTIFNEQQTAVAT